MVLDRGWKPRVWIKTAAGSPGYIWRTRLKARLLWERWLNAVIKLENTNVILVTPYNVSRPRKVWCPMPIVPNFPQEAKSARSAERSGLTEFDQEFAANPPPNRRHLA